MGYCQNEWGGNTIPDGFYNQETWEFEPRSFVCVAPESNVNSEGEDMGWYSCDAYGSWDAVEYSELGCIVKSVVDKSSCDGLTPNSGVWTPTQFDEVTCAGPQKCYNGQWFNKFNEEECTKCGDKFKPLLKWSGNKWNVGSMRACTSGKSHREIACVCGKDRHQCDQAAVIATETALVEATAYFGAKETAGKQLGTKLDVSPDSVNNTAEVKVTSGLYVPAVRNGTGTTNAGTGRRRRLEESENSLNAAECMTVVVNSNNWLVGQLVGDCATFDHTRGSEFFPVAGIGFKNGDRYTVSDITVKVSGSQFCFNVTTTVTACPIMYAADHATATEDLASGASANAG
ncbi:hypothetical protein TrVE_jg10812 [Triparma verrucosa]|uniref:Uncharacterized protein n=1 Tax=Triparma verrucosa TaxID=1606542 RepID=A0A9W7EW72_9STRA|nr:hypothetical protein TrVE_jg10812 [Triparma verrucosa]